MYIYIYIYIYTCTTNLLETFLHFLQSSHCIQLLEETSPVTTLVDTGLLYSDIDTSFLSTCFSLCEADS